MRCPHFIAPIYTPAPAKNPPVFPLQKAERVSVRLCCGKVISIFWVSRKDETQAYPVCDIKEQHIICLDWTDFVRFCSVSAPLDIDECTSGTHGCKHYCVNNDGSLNVIIFLVTLFMRTKKVATVIVTQLQTIA